MTKSWPIAAIAAALTACGGQPATGQPAPPRDASLNRISMYEVPNEALRGQAQEMGPGWIQVNGSGSVDIAPDRASVAFAMETRADQADAAARANADAMDAVLSALRAAGFTGLRLETYGYSLRPEYSGNNNQRTREIVSYTALNNVRATIEDVNAVGRVVDVAIAAGANRVASVGFFASDTEGARAEALDAAVRSARAEAEVIARSLGYRLGPPLEINGGADRPMPRSFEMAPAMAMRAADTPIEAGDQTVTASVSIRFALGPESGG